MTKEEEFYMNAMDEVKKESIMSEDESSSTEEDVETIEEEEREVKDNFKTEKDFVKETSRI